MKIVVTGAVGHIGSYIIRELPIKFPKAEILIIDNMMSKRYSSLFNLPSIGKYNFVDGDVTKMELNPLLESANVVIHLAAITDAAASFDNAAVVEENNYQATLKVAMACAETDTRLIALSSTSVYGTQNTVVDEDCSESELQPQSPYAVTKLKEEKLISSLCLEKGLKATSCRFGTIFGTSPGMRFHTAVNKFCWQAATKQPLSVWTSAYDQKRPYLDLLDASNAINFIIEKDMFDGDIYNILTQNYTVREVVDTIIEFVPGLSVGFVDHKIMNQLSYEVSCKKFKDKGFVFNGNIRSRIEETINMLSKLKA
jgi:UDP-glucose 4-epimerase